MGFLTQIDADIRARLRADPLDGPALRAAAAAAPAPRDLDAALRRAARERGLALLAEVKRASPSAGSLAPEVDPAERARSYAAAGAAAISVLTERAHFGGSLDDLRTVRGAVAVPLLRKDFLVDPLQIAEARAAGADSVLLITACLSDGELRTMLDGSRSWGMEPLVEVHSDEDLERALRTDARIVGVNARDLETLEIDAPAARERLRHVGASRVAVMESGITDAADVAAAAAAGASAILVGEALMRAVDPDEKIRELLAGAPAREIPTAPKEGGPR